MIILKLTENKNFILDNDMRINSEINYKYIYIKVVNHFEFLGIQTKEGYIKNVYNDHVVIIGSKVDNEEVMTNNFSHVSFTDITHNSIYRISKKTIEKMKK